AHPQWRTPLVSLRLRGQARSSSVAYAVGFTSSSRTSPLILSGVRRWFHFVFADKPAHPQWQTPLVSLRLRGQARSSSVANAVGLTSSSRTSPLILSGVRRWFHFVFADKPAHPQWQTPLVSLRLRGQARSSSVANAVGLTSSSRTSPLILSGVRRWFHFVFADKPAHPQWQTPLVSLRLRGQARSSSVANAVGLTSSSRTSPLILSGVRRWFHFVFADKPAHPQWLTPLVSLRLRGQARSSSVAYAVGLTSSSRTSPLILSEIDPLRWSRPARWSTSSGRPWWRCGRSNRHRPRAGAWSRCSRAPRRRTRAP